MRAAGKVSDGATITVTKKDGATKSERVSKVLWTGTDSKTGATISLCSIAQSSSSSDSSNGHRAGKCANCGASCNPRYRRCLDCVDGGGNAHGGQSYYDRNGNFVLGDDD